MSNKEIEAQILIDLSKTDCDVEVEREYLAHIRSALEDQKVETTLGTATITRAVATRLVDDLIRFYLTAELEFPREDKTWTFNSKKGDAATFLALISRQARKWAQVRAGEIIRAEDRQSNILEVRRAKKAKQDNHTDLPFYYEDCACNHCATRQRIFNDDLASLSDGMEDC
ncbi:MAG: hypothetical protein ABI408_08200 [Gemmatimonadaceae bacterium]